MKKRFEKYGVTLTERELILISAAHAAGMSDAYNTYKEIIENEEPERVQDLLDDISEKVWTAQKELATLGEKNRA
jgi:hypothetical protein